MPNLISPPLLLNSSLEPANGTIVAKVTAQFAYGADTVTRAASKGQVVNGVVLNAAGTGPFVLPPTPTDYAVEIWVQLVETSHGPTKFSLTHRTVSVPDLPTVTWDDLVDVVAAAPDGVYGVPTWAAELFTARDDAAASAAAAAQSAADASAALDGYIRADDVVVAIDTDGVPYYADALSFVDAVPVLLDTDGVPYVTI